MATRRTSRRVTGSEPTRATGARAAAIAEQLRLECAVLLELYVSMRGWNLWILGVAVRARTCMRVRV